MQKTHSSNLRNILKDECVYEKYSINGTSIFIQLKIKTSSIHSDINPTSSVSRQDAVKQTNPENPLIAVSTQDVATKTPEIPLIAVSRQDAVKQPNPENPLIAVNTQDVVTKTPENPLKPVSRQAAVNEYSNPPENPLTPVSRQAAVNEVTNQSPENPLTAVSKQYAVNEYLNKFSNIRSSINKNHCKKKKKEKKIAKNKITQLMRNENISIIEITKISKNKQKFEKDSLTRSIKQTKKNKINIKKQKIEKDSLHRIIQKTQKNTKRSKFIPKDLKRTKNPQVKVNYLDNSVLTIKGIIEDIMSNCAPHLWENHILEIINRYDDKNKRKLTCTYRKAINQLQSRLENKKNPYMIRVIITKIIKSYQKRLEKALHTLTSTPPSSEDEDVYHQTTKCVNFVPHITLPDNNELNKNEKNLLSETMKNKNQIEKAVKKSLVEDKTRNNDIKRRKKIKVNSSHTKKIGEKVAKNLENYKNIQPIEKDLSYGIKKTQKKIKSIYTTKISNKPLYEQTKCKNNNIIEKQNTTKILKVNHNIHKQKQKKNIKMTYHKKITPDSYGVMNKLKNKTKEHSDPKKSILSETKTREIMKKMI